MTGGNYAKFVESKKSHDIEKCATSLDAGIQELGVPRDLAVWIGAMVLKTDEQAADMAIWLYRNKETDSQKLLAKAQEIAACNAAS